MFNKLLIAIVMFAAMTIAAQEKSDGRVNLVPPIGEWKLPDKGGWSFEKEGPGGNIAARIKRLSPDAAYTFVSRNLVGLVPMKQYVFVANIKKDNLKVTGSATTGALIGVQMWKGSKHLGGSYSSFRTPFGTTDWQQESCKFVVLKDADRIEAIMFMGRGTVGTAWFADPQIYEDKPVWWTEILAPAMKYAIPPGEQEIVFNSFVFGTQGDSVKVSLLRNGKEEQVQTVSIKGNRYAVRAVLNPGKYSAKVVLSGNGKEITAKEIPLQVIGSVEKRPPTVISFDHANRMLVNGQKVLPIGIYWGKFAGKNKAVYGTEDRIWTLEDFKALKSSPFNFIVSYALQHEKTDTSRGNRWQCMKDILDKMHENGIMVMPTMIVKEYENPETRKQMVAFFKDHPAIMGYHINDEGEVTEKTRNYREAIASQDPFHLIHQSQCHFGLDWLASSIGGGDFISFPIYPFYPDKHNDISSATKSCNSITDVYGVNGKVAGMACFQSFSWSFEQPNLKDYFPTERELRSTALLSAIHGYRAFSFFSYYAHFLPMRTESPSRWVLESKRRLDATWAAAGILRELEGYLLSDSPAPAFALTNISGEVFGCALANDAGKVALLIAAHGPGKSSAEIHSKPGLVSRYHNTKEVSPGKYLFIGTDADSDVLMENNMPVYGTTK